MRPLTASVGKNSVNRKSDVEFVQRLLNIYLSSIIPMMKLEVDGIAGERTLHFIKEFQHNVVGMKIPDSRIDPGGKTIRQLAELSYTAQKKNTRNTFVNSITQFISAISTGFPLKPAIANVDKKNVKHIFIKNFQPSETLAFPLSTRPKDSYKTGARKFGSNRKNGRRHAGCD